MANNNNKLYITISDNRGGSPDTPTPKPQSAEKKQEDDTLGRYIEHEMFHLAKSQMTQAVSFALGNIGNFTGEYIVQRKVNALRQFASGIMNIGTATLAGAKYGAPGAVIGFVVGTVSQLSSGVFERIQTSAEYAKTNYDIAQLRDKVGLNTVYDGSRGTEN